MNKLIKKITLSFFLTAVSLVVFLFGFQFNADAVSNTTTINSGLNLRTVVEDGDRVYVSATPYAYGYAGYIDGTYFGFTGVLGRSKILVSIDDTALEAIPYGAEVAGATLHIYQYAAPSPDTNFKCSMISDSWNVEDFSQTNNSNGFTRASVLGTEYLSSDTAKRGWLSFDISTAVNNWVNGLSEQNGLMITGMENTSSEIGGAFVTNTSIDSAEGQASYFLNKPYITVVWECGHTETYVDGKVEATCTTVGYTGDTYCSDCGELVENGEETPVVAHNLGVWYVTVEPTLTEYGEERRDCSNCEYYETKQIDMANTFTEDGYTYKVIDGVACITKAPLKEELIVPETLGGYTVVSVDGFGVGSDNLTLKSVTIPDTVTKIGSYAFSRCRNLTYVKLSENLEEIGAFAFNICDNLKNIELPETVVAIYEYAFSYCESLEEFTIPSSVTTLGDSVFMNCKSLVDMELPETVTSFGKGLFYGCSGLKNVKIPDSIQRLKTQTFYECSSLESIVLPEDLTVIDMQMFCFCTSLKEITFYSNVISISNYVFADCDNLTDVYYHGTQSQFNSLGIEYRSGYDNDDFYNANFHVLHTAKYGKVISTTASCTESGYTDYECDCGYTWTEKTDSLSHKMEEWYVSKEPTCTSSGVRMRECSLCEYTETSDISPLDHDFSEQIVDVEHLRSDATYTSKATYYYDCSRVGAEADDGVECKAIGDIYFEYDDSTTEQADKNGDGVIDYKDGAYYVRLTSNVVDTGGEAENIITFTFKKNNGTGEDGTKVISYDGDMGWYGQVTIWEGYIEGYPTAAKWVMTMRGLARSEDHRDITLWVGKDADNCNTISLYNTGYKFETPFIGDAKDTCTLSVPEGLETPRPNKDQSFFYDNSGNVFTSDTFATIPDTGDTTVISKDFNAQICDQYGVYWYNAPSFNLSKAPGGTTDMADEESGFWWVDKGASGNSVAVKINEQMQKALSLPLSNTDGYMDYYIVASLTENDGTANISRKIRVLYPGYDWKFDTTVSGTSYTADKIIMNDGSFYDENEDGKPETHFNKVNYLSYNQKASVYPVSAEKEGFDFLGFWSVPQPGVSMQPGDPFSFESEFRYPISRENYDTLTQEDKENYVVAGEQWNPKDSAMLCTEGNKNYYAWWLAHDVSVSFYDLDDTLLKTNVVKYGHRNKNFEWPVPTEQYGNDDATISKWSGKWENIDGEIVNPNGYTFKHNLNLKPVYRTVEATGKYTVAFYNTYGSTAIVEYSKEYNYKDIPVLPGESNVTSIPSDYFYDYLFEGWSCVAPSSNLNRNYHLMIEDYDYDVCGDEVNMVIDFTVRDDASYYPVFRRSPKDSISLNGSCGTKVNYKFDIETLTLTVSGFGPMKDYKVSKYAPWYPLRDDIERVIIEDGVTSIGDLAFYKCKNVSEVVIADTVESIGKYSFNGCDALTVVNIPVGVDVINSAAFHSCDNLAEFIVVENNERFSSVDGVLFNKDATELVKYPLAKVDTEYIIPETVTSIAPNAFNGCSYLTEISVDSNIEIIKESAFYDCADLESVYLGECVNKIEPYAFYDCKKLNSLTLINSAVTIGDWAFYGCKNLSTINYSGASEEWDAYKFGNSNKPLKKATVNCYYVNTPSVAMSMMMFASRPVHEHSYDVLVTEATCTENGYATYTCNGCGDSYTVNNAEKLGHDMGEYVITKQPECNNSGSEKSACQRCEYYETRELAATGHIYDDKGVCESCSFDRTSGCDHVCHKTVLESFVWKILRIIYKIFGINGSCSCGVNHY